MLTEYPRDIKFKYSWRKYQKRVLDNLHEHLSDGHLHVIAPPGSGKTVLGLEVAVRINQPTLILTPTIAIRNQWIQRFCELFLQTDLVPEWISTDIRRPKFMTIATYQGLHAACNNLKIEEEDLEEETEEKTEHPKLSNPNFDLILNGLKAQKIKTIVVDEAHHLKNEWWQTISRIKEGLEPFIVGLTATPPYDVSFTEWQRYIELNGPADTEISIPELIVEEDLCPHQDYVYFTLPTQEEKKNIDDFRKNIDKLFQEIQNDEIIIQAIEESPIWQQPLEQLDWIYNNISYYSACLIFLHANHRTIPETHLEIIGDKNFKIPDLDYEWMEILLDYFLFKEKKAFIPYQEHIKTLENKLRRAGALEKGQISFTQNKNTTGFLISSLSKLNGIKEIVDFEYQKLGEKLRLVILTDFIRKEYYLNADENNLPLNKIGALPIFEKLRRENSDHKKIAVLTGSLVILPLSAFSSFKNKAAKKGIVQFNSSPVPFDKNYIFINQSEQIKQDIVHIVTQIFQLGEIEVLIGTKSLLGEGWDAPAINTLILATFVGSFVLSNQMRGRAIRTQKGHDDKTGNIWHVVCIDPTAPEGGDDFDLLKRRFKSFVGVSFNKLPLIESGIGRLNLSEHMHEKKVVAKKNEEMFRHAGDRESLKKRWKAALKTGNTLVEEIKIPFPSDMTYKTVKSLYFNRTIAYLLATLVSGIIGFVLDILQMLGNGMKHIKSTQELYIILAIIGAIGVAIFGRLTLKALSLYFKYRDISKDIQHIGNALLNSLIMAQ